MKRIYLGMLLGCAFLTPNISASSSEVSANQVAALQKQVEALQKQLLELSKQVKAQEVKHVAVQKVATKEIVKENCPCPISDKKEENAPKFDAGYIPVPGTTSAVKVSGMIKLDAIMDAKNHTGEQQIPSFVPYKLNLNSNNNQTKKHHLKRHFYMHGKQSKICFDSIMKNTSGQDLTGKFEGDFFGNTQFATNNPSSINYSFRLRHAYFDYSGWRAGFTTTTFHMAETLLPSVDLNGLNAGNLIRQPLISYTYKFSNGYALSAGIENPKVDYITYNSAPGAGNANYVYNGRDGLAPSAGGGKPTRPDFVARLQHTFADKSVVGLSVIQRDLSVKYNANNAAVDGKKYVANGYGANITGKLMLNKDNFLTAGYIFGRGLGQYIIEMAGRSAILSDIRDNANTLASRRYRTLPMYQVWLGYSHSWNKQFQSNVGFSYAELRTGSNRSPVNSWIDPGLDKDFTRILLNTIYKPENNMEVGLEYMFIKRQSTLKYKAIGNRYQLAMSYKF